MSEAISYKISLEKVTQHLLTVECRIKKPSEEGQVVSLPAWVPGSYMIRDFAKHLVSIRAESLGKPIEVFKIEKNTWRFAPCSDELLIKYQVYCFDLMPRGAYLDNTRAFFDGCRVFLVVDGEEEQTRCVEILRPKHAWRCATSMKPYRIDADGFGIYIANNHLDLIDHPFEIGTFQELSFTVANVPHKIIIDGTFHGDLERLAKDVEQVCTGQVDFFGELPVMDHYIFILNVLGKGWGGIEHRSSSTLLCARSDLPVIGDSSMSEQYRALLGLFSHEYFHLWNVKRIKPEVFLNPDLTEEVYTRQLWIFEGITSYYDNMNLVQHNIISPDVYLQLLQKDITTLLQNPGTNLQTLEDSSFDAWIKYYQPDENSPNSTVSYYIKGSLVALALDLLIIKNSRRKQSLADLMQVLWQQYGKAGLGVPENYFEHLTYEITGEDYSDFFSLALRTTEPLPLPELFLEVGVIYKLNPADTLDNLGVKFSPDQSKLIVRSVINGSVLEYAGLAANDVVLAINNVAVTLNTIENLLNRYQPNDKIVMHVFRNDILMELEFANPENTQFSCTLEIANNLTESQQLNWQKWLNR
jgi:predicted metalloprotease with PDZ domain